MISLREIFEQYTSLQRKEKYIDFLRRNGRRFVVEQERFIKSQKIFDDMVSEFDAHIEQLLKQLHDLSVTAKTA